MQDPTARHAATTTHHYRFHAPHAHLSSLFGNDAFALQAERFARFFGTPGYLVGQTALVVVWVIVNIAGITHFDVYPFILLNLAFSLQAAYAAPLILLAQTRQADRDKVHADADARHRESIAAANLERQEAFALQTALILQLLERNTELTQMTQALTTRINDLTDQIHRRVVAA
ncbi:MAG: DUF1003 domain-containing protein [Candidatus Binatia bacterium]